MARPIKNNADYFPHDADMRNDPRIKAVRRKFGIEGYGIYTMLVEYLSDCDFFTFSSDKLAIEIIAGDFDIDPDRLREILKYCIELDLFQENNLEITCKSLEKRFGPLLSKRKLDRSGVIGIDNTQSKVKESKVKESKVKNIIVDNKENLPVNVNGDVIVLGNKESNQCFKIIGKYAYEPNYIVYGEDGYRQMITDVLGLPEASIDRGHLPRFLMEKNGTVFEGSPSFVINSFKHYIRSQYK